MKLRLLLFAASASMLVFAVGCGGGSGSGTGGGGGGTPTTVTFTFNGPMPMAVAAKVGNGAFASQTLNSGVLTLSIPTGTSTFALAYVCQPLTLAVGTSTAEQTVQAVLEATTADGTSFSRTCPATPAAAQTGPLAVNVDASGVPGTTTLVVDALNGSSLASGVFQGATANSSFMAPSGDDRVEVFAFNEQTQGIAESLSLVAARNFDGEPVPGSLNGGSAVILGDADRTNSEPITYSSIPSGYTAPAMLVRFDMGNAGVAVIADDASSQYPALPAAAVESGDFYGFSASAHNSSNIGESVLVDTTAATAGPVTIAFPAPWTYAGPAPAALPTFNFNYAGFSGSGAIETASVIWSASALQQNLYEVSATTNYQGGSTMVSLPDLSGLAGFLAQPASGTNVFWGALMEQSSWPPFQAMPLGATATVVTNAGSFSVP
ncbi:MAG TPA: hypothetical protein VKR52_09950 [Terracidiphilus sp.]|nr:hypothetical protein [Terracidiphilus sp.]